MSDNPFYASRRIAIDEPETHDKPWTVRDRRTGAWYGTHVTKGEAQVAADFMHLEELERQAGLRPPARMENAP